MLAYWINLVFVVLETALGTFILARSSHYRPARIFFGLTLCLVVINSTALARNLTTDYATSYGLVGVALVSLGLLCWLMLLLFAALFMPQWWEGSRPIRPISLVYGLSIGLLALDLIGQFGWFTAGIELANGSYRPIAGPAAGLMLALFSLGWLIQLGLLGMVFWRQPATRRSISWLAFAILFSALTNSVLGIVKFEPSGQLASVLQTLPLVLSLTYIVLRGSLFQTKQVAVQQALQTMSEAMVVVDREGMIVYLNNAAAHQLGLKSQQPLQQAFRTIGVAADDVEALAKALAQPQVQAFTQTLALGNPLRLLENAVSPILDSAGQSQGTMLFIRDITELERRTALLEQERRRLSVTVEQLEQEQIQRNQLAQAVQALSFPTIPVLPGVLVLPLIGVLDQQRIAECQRVLMESLNQQPVQRLLIDLTGVQLIDAEGAIGMQRMLRAAYLLGAQTTLIGVRPEVAQALVGMGTNLQHVATAATLQAAIGQIIAKR
ncbi:MAG: PAS domain-containing protein [Chloroflexi bacterium]|nr:PAS domain-containing protein [Chloroflexota bacterium]